MQQNRCADELAEAPLRDAHGQGIDALPPDRLDLGDTLASGFVARHDGAP